jgi:hypothetical protein
MHALVGVRKYGAGAALRMKLVFDIAAQEANLRTLFGYDVWIRIRSERNF